MRTALEIIFWLSCGLIVWTQVGYAAALAALARVFARATAQPAREHEQRSLARGGAHQSSSASSPPALSLIVAAHDEESVIAAKVANALALDYPRALLQVIVACDGCADRTAARATDAGADLVLELPRGGKIRAQDAAVEQARGEIVAFSDANALWEPDAALALVRAFDDPRVGYACGQVRFVRAIGDAAGAQDGAGAGAPNQEGVYWRYELGVRALESRLSSITAGNGAIYATRRDSYIVVDPIMGHDLSLPFNMVKRGLRAVYVPGARASEKMVPSLSGEFARKRRMMSHTWPIVLRGGMLSPRGYPPGYALMILSHRVLRYSTAALHAIALAVNIALVALGTSLLYVVTLDLQLALLLAASLAGVLPVRPLLIARYYVLTTASLAAGLWDWLRHGTSASWEAAEGTR
ncbi:MAG TPA: glycosyltransferase [Solirubrobacteraceae bacterium]|jgi:glycosyltransferase involved in cell wall biosynthesis|nr:glycosyltransferase [Solirubrobacteraceae bacterium]